MIHIVPRPINRLYHRFHRRRRRWGGNLLHRRIQLAPLHRLQQMPVRIPLFPSTHTPPRANVSAVRAPHAHAAGETTTGIVEGHAVAHFRRDKEGRMTSRPSALPRPSPRHEPTPIRAPQPIPGCKKRIRIPPRPVGGFRNAGILPATARRPSGGGTNAPDLRPSPVPPSEIPIFKFQIAPPSASIRLCALGDS